MTSGSRGTYVISWAQTQADGLVAASPDALTVGAVWRWTGQAVRVDGPAGLLQLGACDEVTETRRRAARMVRRLVGAAVAYRGDPFEAEDEGADNVLDPAFILTDGRRSFGATVIATPEAARPLVMFVDEVPPPDTDLWVVRRMTDPRISGDAGDTAAGVICFTPGTLIRMEEGLRPVETLAPGDRVMTRDDGAQEILWIGRRRMTGARLYAMPALRPVRIRAGALGIDRPEPDLLVSPQHRMLIRGRAAQALFNAPEVLVAAEDLVNHRSIAVDRGLREVTYIHLMFERHEVIWANGLETESFHPANTALDMVEDRQRATLLAMYPDIEDGPHSYGPYARRNLSTAEAALLRHDGGLIAA